MADIKDPTGISDWKRKAGLIAYDANGQNSINDATTPQSPEMSHSDNDEESMAPSNEVPEGTLSPFLHEDCNANVTSSLGEEKFENQ